MFDLNRLKVKGWEPVLIESVLDEAVSELEVVLVKTKTTIGSRAEAMRSWLAFFSLGAWSSFGAFFSFLAHRSLGSN